MHYIYKITCLINNKLYIGQAQDPRVRWNNHKLEARQEFPRMIINKAMKKHGIENFTFEVIVTCQTLDDANELETLLVTQYESHISTDKGYNVSLGGSNAPKTDAWKQQISKLAQERAPETSKQMTTIAAARPEDYYEYMKGNTINTGRTQSPEWIEMMRNRERSEEEKAKISESLRASYAAGERTSYFTDKEAWNKGIPMTEEQKEILRQANIGKKHSQETIEKMSGKTPWNKGLAPERQSRFGAKLTNEHKQILKESNKKKRHFTDEQVIAIKTEFAADSSRGAQTRLAIKYGVKQQMINKLINGKSYN